MNSCSLAIEAQSSGTDLCLEVKFNNITRFKKILSTELEKISFEFDDTDDNKQVLEITMSGKQTEHTVLDNAGNIVKDCLININNVSFDQILLGQLFFDQAVYFHNYNGTTEEVQDKFFGTMGCNGTVRLEFFSPVYAWLLQNM